MRHGVVLLQLLDGNSIRISQFQANAASKDLMRMRCQFLCKSPNMLDLEELPFCNHGLLAGQGVSLKKVCSSFHLNLDASPGPGLISVILNKSKGPVLGEVTC